MGIKMGYNFAPYYSAKYYVKDRNGAIVEYFNNVKDAEKFINECFAGEKNNYTICNN